MKMRHLSRCCFGAMFFQGALILSLLAGSGCFAQVDRAGLNGTVTDISGKRIPGAQIVVLQVETGLRRATISSSSGVYDIPELPIGLYRVTCSAPGFKEFLIEGLEQTVGHTRTLNITLDVGGITQQVNVREHGSQLDETTATLGARTEAEQVKELPLNGRNWSTLTALAPGAVDTGGSNQRSIRFAGRGLDDNNFTYDGIDATNIVNQAQQPFVRLAIPTDAIEEFHIDTMLFTAENGSTPGGQIDVASKFGTNTPHGSLFEFLRNDVLDARDPILPSRLPFHLNQFGGNLGGRLVRDRSFYFFTYEGLRQSYGQPLSGFVPSPSFAAQVAAANPALRSDPRRLSNDRVDTLCHGYRSVFRLGTATGPRRLRDAAPGSAFLGSRHGLPSLQLRRRSQRYPIRWPERPAAYNIPAGKRRTGGVAHLLAPAGE